jgi:hypothetical protein
VLDELLSVDGLALLSVAGACVLVSLLGAWVLCDDVSADGVVACDDDDGAWSLLLDGCCCVIVESVVAGWVVSDCA